MARPWFVLLLLATAAAPGGSAVEAPGVPEFPQASCRSPPCGYILPMLDLEFPEKPRCSGPYGDINADTCIPLIPDGGQVSFSGVMRWYWLESEDGIYPMDASAPIEITIGSIAKNPSWLKFQVEPDTFVISMADLADPANHRSDRQGESNVVWFWYERPVEVTFTREGSPSAEEWTRFVEREGVQPVYVKAKSTASGAFYKESFGGEEFRFNATSLLAKEHVQRAPMPALGLIALVGLALAARRR